MGPKSLIGKRSLGAAQFRLNTKYPVGTTLSAKVGYFGLGVHRTLNLALEPTYGQPAWNEYIRNTQAAMASVHTGSGVMPYTTNQLSMMLVQCYMIDLQLRELRRNIKMLDWSSPTTLEGMKDFWGPSESIAIATRAIKSQLVNRVNAYADTFYTTYPFRKPNFITFLGELLSNVYRDDKDQRTNYIYFNLFDKPWDAVVGSDPANPIPFEAAFKRLDTWLNPANPNFATQSVFGRLLAATNPTPNVLPMLIGDYRAVFGNAAMQSLPLLFPQDAIDVVFDQDLINTLNASPTGDTELAYYTRGNANTYTTFSGDMSSTNNAWLVSRPDLTTWAASVETDSLNWGPRWGTDVVGLWNSTLARAQQWTELTRAINNRVWDYPVYHGFDGETILADFAFTTIMDFITQDASVTPATFDPIPDFSHTKGALVVNRYGLFGIYITDTVSYCINSAGVWNLYYAQGLNYWNVGGGATGDVARFNVPLCQTTAQRNNYLLIENSRQMAYTMDAMTNWDFTYYPASNTYTVVTDEDVDEWTILPTVDLISNYGATAKGMFDSDTAITKQSSRVEDVSLLERTSGFKAKGKGRGEGYGKGKRSPRNKH